MLVIFFYVVYTSLLYISLFILYINICPYSLFITILSVNRLKCLPYFVAREFLLTGHFSGLCIAAFSLFSPFREVRNCRLCGQLYDPLCCRGTLGFLLC